MALITLRQLLDHAAEHGYGVPAFNVDNLERCAPPETGIPVLTVVASDLDPAHRENGQHRSALDSYRRRDRIGGGDALGCGACRAAGDRAMAPVRRRQTGTTQIET